MPSEKHNLIMAKTTDLNSSHYSCNVTSQNVPFCQLQHAATIRATYLSPYMSLWHLLGISFIATTALLAEEYFALVQCFWNSWKPSIKTHLHAFHWSIVGRHILTSNSSVFSVVAGLIINMLFYLCAENRITRYNGLLTLTK